MYKAETIQQFGDAIRSFGLEPPDVIEPDKLHRFPGIGKRNGNTAGWCKLFADGLGGVFGDWSQDLFETWQAKRDKPFRETERQAFKERCEQERQARQAERSRQRADACKEASDIWKRAT